MSLLALLFLAAAPPADAAPVGAPPGARDWHIIAVGDGGEIRYALPRVSERDYPQDLQDAGFEGTSLLALKVDPEGRIVRCDVVESAGHPLLDARACEIYRERARFVLRGIASDLHFRAPVTWKLLDE